MLVHEMTVLVLFERNALKCLGARHLLPNKEAKQEELRLRDKRHLVTKWCTF